MSPLARRSLAAASSSTRATRAPHSGRTADESQPSSWQMRVHHTTHDTQVSSTCTVHGPAANHSSSKHTPCRRPRRYQPAKNSGLCTRAPSYPATGCDSFSPPTQSTIETTTPHGRCSTMRWRSVRAMAAQATSPCPTAPVRSSTAARSNGSTPLPPSFRASIWPAAPSGRSVTVSLLISNWPMTNAERWNTVAALPE